MTGEKILKSILDEKVQYDYNRAAGTVLELCVVTHVNIKELTVKAYVLDSKKEISDVPFAFPYRRQNAGILYMPEKGSIAIIGWFTKNQPLVLAFASLPSITIKNGKMAIDNSLNAEPEQEELLNPGEYLFRGKYNNIIHFTDIGDILISANSNAFIELIERSGLIKIWSSNLEEQTEVHRRVCNSTAKEKQSDVYYNTLVEEIYELTDSSIGEDDIDTIAQNILRDKDELSDAEQKQVIVRIKKGTVLDSNNDIILLNGSQVCLCIEILNEEANAVGTVMMNKSGHFLVQAPRVDVAANTINIAGGEKGVARVDDELELIMNSAGADSHTHTFSVAKIKVGSTKVKCG